MIDESDADFAVLMGPGNGPIGFVLWLILVGVICFFACRNEDECSKKHCDHGHPVLTAHQCMCVEAAE